MALSDSRPIGVFDSGVGGLTVLKELALHFPQESFIYLGDTAHLPYGSKSPESIRKYCEQNMAFLQSLDAKAIVIACNTASAQVPENEFHGLPIYNVIDPGAETAVKASLSSRIGVLGTQATINSKAYTKKILQLNPTAKVFDQACPLFVPLAEEGWDQDPITNLIVYRYLSPVLENDIDTLIMGCTHYTILKQAIEKVAGSSIELVDSGKAIALWMEDDFKKQRLQSRRDLEPRTIHLMTTDHSAQFADVATRVLKPLTRDSLKVVTF